MESGNAYTGLLFWQGPLAETSLPNSPTASRERVISPGLCCGDMYVGTF